MGVIKTKGVILARSNMGDNDQMVTILTPDLGKIGVAAKGSRRPKSTLMAGTQFLCFADLVIYKSVGSYNLNSCEPIEIFYNIRLDIDKLTVASEIAKIINDVTEENDNCYNVLRLLLNTLYVISETDKDLKFVLSIFKIRLLSIIGYRPEIEKCTECGEKTNLKYFSFKNHGVKCQACGKQDRSAMEISEATLKALRFIIWADAKKVFSFDIPDDDKKQLEILSKIYLNNCVEKEYE